MTLNTKRNTWSDSWPLAAIAAASAAICFLGAPAAAQQQPRALPTFAVDALWPKIPDKYKLGDISSIALDAQDNAYVLHRPRTLKPEEQEYMRWVTAHYRELAEEYRARG